MHNGSILLTSTSCFGSDIVLIVIVMMTRPTRVNDVKLSFGRKASSA